MSNLKLLEAKKLHYKKYLYKLKLNNPLSRIFRTERQRGGKLEFARSEIDKFCISHANGEPLQWQRYRTLSTVDFHHVEEARHIYNAMRSETEYLLRCEYQTLIIYSNNKKVLTNLSKKLSGDVELWEPDKNVIKYLMSNSNVIITDKPTDFPIKVTFGRKKANPALASWIDNNTDKVKVGSVLHKNLRQGHTWIQGQYIFVRDEGVMLLLNIMIGDNIGGIDKLVYKGDIDK